LGATTSRFLPLSMPIRPYLDGHRFDGETTIRHMGIAFELALASSTPDPNDPIRAALAQRIIALAKAGEPERLCEGPCSRAQPC
jgi:hypothetical protein